MAGPQLQTLECGAAQPEHSVIWLHGLGASGHDFEALVPHLGLAATRFVFPHAPRMPVTINGGFVMPAWYDIRHMGPSPDRESQTDIESSARLVRELIEREVERGVDADQIVLAGFSQGAAMALYTGLRYEHRLAGILCLSGYMVIEHEFPACVHAANADTAIAIHHGRRDGVVPIDRGRAAFDALVGQPGGKARTLWHEYDMEHELCGEQIGEIARWLHARGLR